MNLPDPVSSLVAEFLSAVDAEAPGLIEGLYLVGSLALGDFRAHTSDVDFIAVTAQPLDAASQARVARVHAQIAKRYPRPFFDGIYVTWSDLAADPARASAGPHTHEHHFHTTGGGERIAVTWHMLGQSGICCRGPAVAALDLWDGSAELARWTDTNLEQYWRHLHTSGARLFTLRGLAMLSPYMCAWCVLGVSRLHYTLSTGMITSKEGAGVYALTAFPARWHRVIYESLRIRRADRRRSLYLSPLARRRAMLAFLDMAITDAHRLYARGRLACARH